MGELGGVARHPITGHGFQLRRCWLGVFVQAAVTFNLAHLLAHTRTEQGVLIGKAYADAISIFAFAAPGYIAGISGAWPQGGDMQVDRRAWAPGSRPIAGDAAAADSMQALAGQGRRGTLDQLDSDIIRVR